MMKCMTVLYGGVDRQTSTPHKSWNKMKGKKGMEQKNSSSRSYMYKINCLGTWMAQTICGLLGRPLHSVHMCTHRH